MTRRVRVLVWHADLGAPEELLETYHQVSRKMAGTAGLLGNELLRSTTEPGTYVLISEWESLAAFRAWDVSDGHLVTVPLRRFRDPRRPGRPFDICEVDAAY
nr:monooxygenase [uncultured bacterium]